MAVMHLSNILFILLAGRAVSEIASTTTRAHIEARPSPKTTHAFEILTTTIYINGTQSNGHKNDGGALSPRSVCARGIPVLSVQCPDNAYCDLKEGCICPGCCKKDAVCTGCPKASIIMDAAGKLHTTCVAAVTVVVTGQNPEIVPRTPSPPEASITASSTGLAEPLIPIPVSNSVPTPSASTHQGQAALQRGVVQPFAWLSRLMSSLSVRLTQALPIKMRESSVAGRVYGSLIQSETTHRTVSQSAVETPPLSSHGSSHSHRDRAIGDHRNSHQHKHRHLDARKLNTTTTTVTVTVDKTNSTNSTSSSSNLSISFTATAWFTTTSTSTTTVFTTQAAAESTRTCDLRRRRDL